MKTKKVKGYKVFNEDLTCRGFQFGEGKTFIHPDKIELCRSGFHFHENIKDLFNYYSFSNKIKVAEVEAVGEVIAGKDKSVTNELKIVHVLSIPELLDIMNVGKNNSGIYNSGDQNSGYWNSGSRNSGYQNSGNWNSGDQNSGDWNSGNWNSGDQNSGYWNSGNRNSGNWNSGNWNSGNFNTNDPEIIRVFNKEIKRELWEQAYKPQFLFFDTIIWISGDKMTNLEKRNNPSYKTVGGYLKKLDYKKVFKRSWDNADPDDRIKIKELPGFDSEIFYEISGIRVE